jgi:2,5-furandicarboxylate decarboxylase 1
MDSLLVDGCSAHLTSARVSSRRYNPAMRTTSSPQSLSGFLDRLEASGDLHRVHERVDLLYEPSAWLLELAHGPAVLFESLGEHALPAVGNVLNSLPRVARGLGVDVSQIQERILAAIRAPMALRTLHSGPCQEVAVDSPDLGAELPVPWFYPGETGRYITAGAIVARDSVSGKRNLSFARLKLLGGNRAFVGIAPNHHLAVMARAAQERGEKLEIAVTIGNHPAVLIAAALYLGLGDDELEVAGAILGEPIEVVPCAGVALEVPAHCEIVLEGVIDLDDTHEEGPVSEFHGLYENYGVGAVATFSRLTRRHDALFQVIQPGYHPEHSLIGGVAIAAGLSRRLADAGIPVGQVAVGHGGCGRLDAVVSVRSPRIDGKAVIQAVWDSVSLVKNVTVVDDDIDPWEGTSVEWAVATRMKPERDLVFNEGAPTDRSEPLKREGKVTKLGIDATRKIEYREDWTLAAPPAEILEKVRARLRGPTEP